eukprot:11696399-Heterocapsa_arctica.AAC.1
MSCVIRNHFGFAACRGVRRSRGQAPPGVGSSVLPRLGYRTPNGAADARASRHATQKVPDR